MSVSGGKCDKSKKLQLASFQHYFHLGVAGSGSFVRISPAFVSRGQTTSVVLFLLSIHPSIHSFIYLSIPYSPTHLPSIHSSIHSSTIHPPIHQLHIHPSTHPPFIPPYIHSSTLHSSIHPPTPYPFIHPSICPPTPHSSTHPSANSTSIHPLTHTHPPSKCVINICLAPNLF